MGLRTAKEYRDGLRDDRRVFYRGQRVASVGDHPELTLAGDHSAHCFDIAQSHPELAVADGYSAFYRVPRSAEQLRARGELVETVSRLGGGIITLKEVGSDAMFALLRTLEGAELARAKAFHERVCRDDLALAVAQTDVNCDRSLARHQQGDPDLYLRIVDEDADSITVRGAKCHTSYSANADELIVLPTRAMGPDDADYAVSFAIPVDTPGLNIYVSPYLAGERKEFEFPLSSKHKMLESLTVFDDVRVPKERVVLNRRPELAGPLAIAFVDYHRFTAINYKLPPLDLLVGSASLIAEYNGIARRAREGQDHAAHGVRRDRAGARGAGLAAVAARAGRHPAARPRRGEHGEVHLRARLPRRGGEAHGPRRRAAHHRPRQ